MRLAINSVRRDNLIAGRAFFNPGETCCIKMHPGNQYLFSADLFKKANARLLRQKRVEVEGYRDLGV
ncbi:Hypothetical protein EAG7_05246 [Klebsiella aerogenes]|nr:Hypothetical protein EAG7_05246 [Klebsiella aerogenes]PVF74721.1 hypothetical protein CSC18_1569 [Klebsiella aerogenes]